MIGSRIARLSRATAGGAKRLKLAAKRRFDWFSPVCILPFRSHGQSDRLVVMGRVLESSGVVRVDGRAPQRESALRNLRATVRRFDSDEVPGARLIARFGRVKVEMESDVEGYFQGELRPEQPVPPGWHEVEIELVESMAGAGARVQAEVLVPPADADFAVVSDIDDTIVHSAVTNRLRMIRIVLFQNARTRAPFPGVAAFYRALKLGPSGVGANPLFYVSKSPWNLYDLFNAFFELHAIPRGPLFLRDLHLLEAPSRALGAEQDKLSRVRKLLAAYPSTPFVLIGDSGQKDPEVYREIALSHPGRVRAVYIRDVTSESRRREVQALADEIRAHGVPLLLTAETLEAARHASDLGLIAPSALAEIGLERERDVRGEQRPGQVVTPDT